MDDTINFFRKYAPENWEIPSAWILSAPQGVKPPRALLSWVRLTRDTGDAPVLVSLHLATLCGLSSAKYDTVKRTWHVDGFCLAFPPSERQQAEGKAWNCAIANGQTASNQLFRTVTVLRSIRETLPGAGGKKRALAIIEKELPHGR